MNLMKVPNRILPVIVFWQFVGMSLVFISIFRNNKHFICFNDIRIRARFRVVLDESIVSEAMKISRGFISFQLT